MKGLPWRALGCAVECCHGSQRRTRRLNAAIQRRRDGDERFEGSTSLLAHGVTGLDRVEMLLPRKRLVQVRGKAHTEKARRRPGRGYCCGLSAAPIVSAPIRGPIQAQRAGGQGVRSLRMSDVL